MKRAENLEDEIGALRRSRRLAFAFSIGLLIILAAAHYWLNNQNIFRNIDVLIILGFLLSAPGFLKAKKLAKKSENK